DLAVVSGRDRALPSQAQQVQARDSFCRLVSRSESPQEQGGQNGCLQSLSELLSRPRWLCSRRGGGQCACPASSKPGGAAGREVPRPVIQVPEIVWIPNQSSTVASSTCHSARWPSVVPAVCIIVRQ